MAQKSGGAELQSIQLLANVGKDADHHKLTFKDGLTPWYPSDAFNPISEQIKSIICPDCGERASYYVRLSENLKKSPDEVLLGCKNCASTQKKNGPERKQGNHFHVKNKLKSAHVVTIYNGHGLHSASTNSAKNAESTIQLLGGDTIKQEIDEYYQEQSFADLPRAAQVEIKTEFQHDRISEKEQTVKQDEFEVEQPLQYVLPDEGNESLMQASTQPSESPECCFVLVDTDLSRTPSCNEGSTHEFSHLEDTNSSGSNQVSTGEMLHKLIEETVEWSADTECVRCNERVSKEGFVKHLIYSHGYHKYRRVRFQCLFCKISSFTMKTLIKHYMLEVHNEHFQFDEYSPGVDGKIFCRFCSFQCKPKHMLMHILLNHSIRYSCGYCGARFSDKETINYHIVSHPNYESKKCNSSFKEKLSRDLHELLHSSYICHLCSSLKIHSQSVFQLHMKNHHRQNTIQDCAMCGFTTDAVALFKAHMVECLDGPMPAQKVIKISESTATCVECCKNFQNPMILGLHMLTHSHINGVKIGPASDLIQDTLIDPSTTASTTSSKKLEVLAFSEHYVEIPVERNVLAIYKAELSRREEEAIIAPKKRGRKKKEKNKEPIDPKPVKVPVVRRYDKTYNLHFLGKVIHVSYSKVGKFFICGICNIKFNMYASMAMHIRTHKTVCCKDCKYLTGFLKGLCSLHSDKSRVIDKEETKHAFYKTFVSRPSGVESIVKCKNCHYYLKLSNASDIDTIIRLSQNDEEIPQVNSKQLSNNSENLECPTCKDFKPKNQSDFEEHMALHRSRFMCPLCLLPVKNFELHFQHFHPKLQQISIFRCRFCKDIISGPAIMTHMKNHLFIKCVNCPFVSNSKSNFVKHCLKVHPVTGCLRAKNNLYSLFKVKSWLTSKESLYWKCSFCNKKATCPNKSWVQEHIDEHHLQSCPKCPIKAVNLKRHINKTGHNHTFHNCGYCDFKSQDESILQNHMKIHFVKCPVCRTVFFAKIQLAFHMKKAHGVTSIVCKVCKGKYLESSDLRKHFHKKKHIAALLGSRLRARKCRQCDFKCLSLKQRDFHSKKRHTECKFCDTTFTNKAAQKLHEHGTHEHYLRCFTCQKQFDRHKDFKAHFASKKHKHVAFSKVLDLTKRSALRKIKLDRRNSELNEPSFEVVSQVCIKMEHVDED